MLVRRAAEHRSLRAENIRLKKSIETVAPPPPLLGASPAMRHVQDLVETVSSSDSTVLVTGESGTGKEVVARAIHAASPRRYNPMVVVNCGALPEGILESELFGHEAGSFTGARARHKGKFESAEGGTVFLDEIGEVSPKVQVELLRVLEEKVVTRLGGTPRSGRLPGHLGDQPRPAGGDPGGPLPRGPLLAPQRRPRPHPARCASGRRTCRCSPSSSSRSSRGR
jgi:transcriptional regulator with GAF, ATPase, and Fis domain